MDTSKLVYGKRTEPSLSIYNQGTSTVSEKIVFDASSLSLSRDQSDSDQQQQEKKYEIVVSEISSDVDNDSIFASTLLSEASGAAGRDSSSSLLNVYSVEYKNPYGLSTFLELLRGKTLEFVDTTPTLRNETRSFRGKLLDVSFSHSTLFLEQEEDGSILLAPFNNRELEVRSQDRALSENNLTRPFIKIGVVSVEDTQQELTLNYETGGLNYEFVFVFLIEANEKDMGVLLKASISNNTGSEFLGASIKLIERPDTSPTNVANYKVNYNQKYNYKKRQQQDYAETSRAVGMAPALLPSPSGGGGGATVFEPDAEPPSEEQEASPDDGGAGAGGAHQQQKTFHIHSRVDIPRSGKTDFNVQEHAGVPSKMEYVYQPGYCGEKCKITNQSVLMNLVWKNVLDDGGSQLSLPRSTVYVYQKESGGGAPTFLAKLPLDADKYANKKTIRMVLGETNTLSGELENIGSTTRYSNQPSSQGTTKETVTQYRLKFSNMVDQERVVVFRYQFPNAAAFAEGDLKFENDKADNPDESISVTNKRAFIAVPKRSQLLSSKQNSGYAVYNFAIVSPN